MIPSQLSKLIFMDIMPSSVIHYLKNVKKFLIPIAKYSPAAPISVYNTLIRRGEKPNKYAMMSSPNTAAEPWFKADIITRISDSARNFAFIVLSP
jgi:hypothetical protein